jgi:hypothetical protein
MNIQHNPNFDVGLITEHYSKKDGVSVKYVCTTDLNASDVPVDVYYRETPHPEFGNKYFGLYHDHVRNHLMICNADIVESFEFGMIEEDGKYYYSQSHHDYKTLDNGKMIDGGRQYIRSSKGCDVIMRIVNGKFIAKDVESLVDSYQPGGCVQQ